MSAGADSLALRVLAGAGPRLRQTLSDDDAVAALERCLQTAVRAFLARIADSHSGDESRQSEATFGDYFARDDVGRELGAMLRGQRLSVEDLEFLLVEQRQCEESVAGFVEALTALEIAFVRTARDETRLESLPLDRLTAAVETSSDVSASLPQGLGGDVSADRIMAHNVVATQVNIHPEVRVTEADPGAEAEDEEHRLRACYLHRVMKHAGFLALSGVDPSVAGSETDASLRLDAVYTALLTQTPQETEKLPERQGRRSPALEQLNRHDRLVLLGDPGSGKSTFANFVALCLAGELLGQENASLELLNAPLPGEKSDDEAPKPTWNQGPLLPVRVILRDFVARGLPDKGEAGTAEGLWRFLEGELERAAMADYAPYLKQTLQRDGGLILLDGLDEVPEAEGRRKQILEAVQDFAATFSPCRFLVTCRTYAYQHQKWRLPGFSEAILDSLNETQIRHFIDRWYGHVAQLRQLDPADAKGRAELLKSAIFGSDRLKPLAERPLLLTLMASLHAWRGGSLPDRREELYHNAVQLLLDFWEQRRVVVDAVGKAVVQQESLAEWLRVDRGRVRKLLNELAYEAHAAQPDLADTADIAEENLVARLMKVSGNPDLRPARLVEFLRDRAGLLLARGVGVYAFPHRTFQEYLAACHLTDHDFPKSLAEIARDDKERWREVALLAGAKSARGSAANPWNLADALCYRTVGSEQRTDGDVHGAHLAGLVLAEAADLGQIGEHLGDKLNRIRDWQIDLLTGSDLPARDRAECGRTLAHLGDPRQEVTVIEEMQYCWVPAGPFRMGADKSDRRSMSRERPAGNVSVPNGFWIGRFPVTQALFGTFVEDGGYSAEMYWPEAIEAGAWRDGTLEVREWRAGKNQQAQVTGPQELADPFGCPNHPVVGVNWFEARAFCRWLTHKLRQSELLDESWSVELPNEPEWEKATRGGFDIPASPIIASARHTDKDALPATMVKNPVSRRVYPWGDEIDGEHANWLETGIGVTSAAGCFPRGRSPYGCEDMGGNVWEWTRNRHENYPYDPSDGREEAKGASGFVLRGGGFGDVNGGVRCSARNDVDPSERYDFVGFRVVLSPSGL